MISSHVWAPTRALPLAALLAIAAPVGAAAQAPPPTTAVVSPTADWAAGTRLELRGARASTVGASRLFGIGHTVAIGASTRVRPRLGVWAGVELSPLAGRRIGDASTGVPVDASYVSAGVLTPLAFGTRHLDRLRFEIGAGVGATAFYTEEYYVDPPPGCDGAPPSLACSNIRGSWLRWRPLATAFARADLRIVRRLALSVTGTVHATHLGRTLTNRFTEVGGGVRPFTMMYVVPVGVGLSYRF